MSKRQGPPKHQNSYAWKPNAGRKINETEVGGKLRPFSEITGVCQRCKEQIDWKRRYGKYKPLKEPAKCQRCSKRAVRQAYHNLCTDCAKEQKVCAKCCSPVGQIVGRDSAEVEAEQKILEEAIKNARERDRRRLLRAMNKGKTKSSDKTPSNDGNKVRDLFPNASLEEYATKGRDSSRGSLDSKVNCTTEEEEEEEEEDDDDNDEGEEHVGDDDNDEGSDEEEEDDDYNDNNDNNDEREHGDDDGDNEEKEKDFSNCDKQLRK